MLFRLERSPASGTAAAFRKARSCGSRAVINRNPGSHISAASLAGDMSPAYLTVHETRPRSERPRFPALAVFRPRPRGDGAAL